MGKYGLTQTQRENRCFSHFYKILLVQNDVLKVLSFYSEIWLISINPLVYNMFLHKKDPILQLSVRFLTDKNILPGI